MHHRISRVLHALRQDLAARLGDDVIGAACRAAGHTWCDSCLLTPAAIIHWFLVQVLHGNTALTHVSLLAGRAFSASAFCQARARLPLEVFRTLLRDMVRAVIPDTEAIGRWRGQLTAGDVLVADRGFCSFAGLATAMSRGVHAVFRLHQKQIVDFTPGRAHARPGQKRVPRGIPRTRWIRACGLKDQVVEYFKPAERPDRMSEEEYRALPGSIVVRELRYRIEVPGFRTREVTLVTTLIDAELYPADALAGLYGNRWRVEEHLKALKQTMKMDVLKCMTVDGVLKELTMYAVAYNLVRAAMVQAAGRQDVVPDRVSFIDALRWLRGAEAGGEMPELVVNPWRPGRSEPRCKKRRPKQYDLMRAPRAELRKRLREKDLAA